MCGIAGIIGTGEDFNGSLKKMLLATKHRGPDHTGIYHDRIAYIGMNRLSIIDRSESGNQPFYSDDGRYILVYNGEVYNYREIRAKLIKEGFLFSSNTDSEVVLKAFLHYGREMLQQLRGMFAFTIWDKEEKKIFGARDHFGIKNLLYAKVENAFVFCSELKGLLASGLFKDSKLSKEAISSFISIGNTISPYTIVDGIYNLKAGHYFEYQNDSYIEKPYWLPQDIERLKTKDISFDEAAKKLKRLILNSVDEELMSDVPLGVFQSGGLDSCIVTAAMRECGVKSIKTFTIGFEEKNQSIDERSMAKIIADYYQTDHYSYSVKNSQIKALFPKFIEGLDQPSSDGFNTFLVSKFASREVTVTLSGLGGDELFVGYSGFIDFINRKPQFPFKLISWLGANPLIELLPNKIFSAIYEEWAAKDDIYYYLWKKQRNNTNFHRYLNSNLGISKKFNIKVHQIISNNYQLPEASLLKVQLLYANQFMGNMLLRDSDAVAMISSLEVRFPIIDKRIAEFAFSMPAEYLLPDNMNSSNRNYMHSNWKKLLVAAFKNDLPREVLNQEKRGFQLPIVNWLQNGLRDIVSESIQNPSPVFDKKMVTILYKKWTKKPKNWKGIWTYLMLDSWYKFVYDR